ncbi:hypothetical protein SOVF_089100 [Spinacia oleracea]|nr:hypothetical protein SOVF_089100 [Spinacia oleracea]
MDNSCRSSKEFDKEWYFKVLVASSLGLQILLYLAAPWRKRSTSKTVQALIFIIFSLSNWIPALTLILISSYAVFSYDRGTTGHESPLLTWASLMLLHLAGHGQEREFPLSLNPGEITRESYKVIFEFLFYNMVFLIAFLFQFESWKRKTMPVTLTFVLLAWTRTFAKLKHLRDRCNEINQKSSKPTLQLHSCETGQVMELNEESVALYARYFFKRFWRLILGHHIQNGNPNNTSKTSYLGLNPVNTSKSSYLGLNSDNTSESSYLWLNPKSAARIVEAELKLIYYKFYGGVVPYKFELLIITVLLSVEFSSSPLFIATIFLNNYVILYAILFLMSTFKVSLFTAVKEVEIPLLSTALLALPPLSKSLYICSLDFSNNLLYILLITHHLVAYPIMQTHYFPHVYRNDPHYWPRWSRKILRFNLLTYSLRKPSKMSATIHYILNTWSLSGKEKYNDEIGEFIFSELRNIIFKLSDDPLRKLNATRQIIAAKGLWVLKQDNHHDLVDCEASFEERVLLWHVATSILYHTSSTNTRDDDQSTIQPHYMSMLLSDYMGYLLIVQPWIMSKRRGAALRRCLEMWTNIYELTKDSGIQGYPTQGMQLERIFEELISQQQSSGNDKTQTALQDAYILAKKLELQFPDVNQKWSFIVKVWVEKLAYAAFQCNPIDHIHGLSQGGELASIIWLWMVHFESVPESALTVESLPKLDPQMMYTYPMRKSRTRHKKR